MAFLSYNSLYCSFSFIYDVMTFLIFFQIIKAADSLASFSSHRPGQGVVPGLGNLQTSEVNDTNVALLDQLGTNYHHWEGQFKFGTTKF